MGKSEEAIRLGKLSVELDPMQTLSYLFLANSLAGDGNFVEAISNLKKAQEISNIQYPDLVPYHVLNHEIEEAIQENSKLSGEIHNFNEILIQHELKNSA